MILKTDHKQQTIAQDFFLEGKGIHTGLNVKIVVKPAPENHGIVFKRVDLEGQPEVSALASNVLEIKRSTVLRSGNAEVGTCEHIMAAFAGMGIDNALVEINAPELPIMDGSSKYFVQAIEQSRILQQSAFREEYVIDEVISFKDEKTGSEITVFPHDGYQLMTMVDFDSEIIGSQNAFLDSISKFKNEISTARTFCFLHELEALLDRGLIKGGDIGNAIVYVDKTVSQVSLDRLKKILNREDIDITPNGILNNVTLHFHNEAARHKMLDVIGDLALIGMPIRGKIVAYKPGHAVNTQFANKIQKAIKKERKSTTFKIDLTRKPLMEVTDIIKTLPHRPPFLLVDRIIEMSENHVVGIKNVTMNEPFFVGHFPEAPILPGVLQIEAMAQVGGILVLSSIPDPENYLTFFMKIDNARFKKQVVPGDVMVLRLTTITPTRRGICHMKGEAFVREELVSEAELLAQVIKVYNN